MRFRYQVAAAVCSILLSISPGPAHAAGAAVRIGGRVVLRLVGTRKLSAAKRAVAVQAKVDAALHRLLPPSRLGVVVARGHVALVWAGHPICTVDPLQARRNHTTARLLAFKWVRNIRSALADGYLSVAPGRLTMPVGSIRHVAVNGVLDGQVEARFDSRGLDVKPSDDGNTLTVQGVAPGSWRIDVLRDGARVTLPVVVKEWAGTVPDQISFSVTGNPADRDLLRQAAIQAARRAVRPRPGAEVTLKGPVNVPDTLAMGSQVTVSLSLTIYGPAYYPVNKSLSVAIRNEAVPFETPRLLMVSNRPEKIEQDGVLFRGTFHRSQPTRLLFSHVNGSNKIQYLWVNITNRADKPVRLLVLDAEGGPAREELYVGQKCNVRFLEDLARHEGMIVTIPPRKAWELGSYQMAPKELVSGLCQLQILDGSELEVSVETSSDPQHVGDLANVIESPYNPFHIHPKGVFNDPEIHVDEKFVVGAANQAQIRFGLAPWLIDGSSGEPNAGNYGVMYDMRLEVSNPTQESRTVSLFFEPMSGVALGSFLVEGKLMETNCLKPPARALISTVELAPQENRAIRIRTLPQPGSWYPAEIVIESSAPGVSQGASQTSQSKAGESNVQETHREAGGT